MDAAPLDEVPPPEALPTSTDPVLAAAGAPAVDLPQARASLPPLAYLKERSDAMALDLAALSRVRILFGDADAQPPAPATEARPSLAVKAAQTTLVVAQKSYVVGGKLAAWIGVLTVLAELAARQWPHYLSPFSAILNALATAGATPPGPPP